MGKHWAGLPALFVVLGLAGCSSPAIDIDPKPKDESKLRLGEKAEVDVRDWLKLPRNDLAKLCREWSETVEAQRKIIRSTPTSVEVLPKFLPPFHVPGLDRAAFSEVTGFSLPPYAEPGKPDAVLALHYARMGDREAAGKLADESTRADLKAIRYENAYPIEWTRLVGLVLISSHLKLSIGDVDGATNLVRVHEQLREALDPKAAVGPLGSALLPWGRRALQAASEAYRDPKQNQTDLADDIDKALTVWGEVPAPAPALVPGAPRDRVLAVLGGVPQGKAIVCGTPEAIARALDALTLPLPPDGVQSVVGFLDGADKLTELQIAYRPKIDTLYPTPAVLAYLLLERQATPGELEVHGFQHQAFALGKLRFDVTRTDRSLSVGCLVRIAADRSEVATYEGRSLTQFGPIDLGVGYESNRVRVAVRQGGSPVTVRDSEILKKLSASLQLPPATLAVLTREKDRDLVAAFQLGWTSDDNTSALQRLLPPLWAAFGPGAMADIDDGAGSYLSFTWRNKDNEVQLRLPYDDHSPTFLAHDLRPTEKPDRLAEVRSAEAKVRDARLAAGKPESRLPRTAGIANELSFAGLRLGQTRAAALAALPKGKNYMPGKGDDWASVAVLTAPTETATTWLRQIRLRFGDDDRVVEMRMTYQPGPKLAKKGQTMLDQLSDAKAGAPETIPARWAGLWADLGAGKTASHRWSDDRTIRLYSEDAAGMEVILRDRSDKEPGPWQWLGTGVGAMRLGRTAAEIEAKGRKPVLTTDDGATVYRASTEGPYEMVLVYYTGGKGEATRVVAVHRDIPNAEPKEVTAALNRVWGKEIATLGFVRRQQPASGLQLGAYFWHDDRVRVKTWAETTEKGPRLRTEWCHWPIETR